MDRIFVSKGPIIDVYMQNKDNENNLEVKHNKLYI